LFYKLGKYCDELQDLLTHLPKDIQLSRIISRELEKFRAALAEVEQRTKQSEIAFEKFKTMYSTLYKKELSASEIEVIAVKLI
jgi:hypothetical protein